MQVTYLTLYFTVRPYALPADHLCGVLLHVCTTFVLVAAMVCAAVKELAPDDPNRLSVEVRRMSRKEPRWRCSHPYPCPDIHLGCGMRAPMLMRGALCVAGGGGPCIENHSQNWPRTTHEFTGE